MDRHPNETVNGRWFTLPLAVVVFLLLLSVWPGAQTFSSGSTGSDGALDLPANQGTVVFDPADAARWGRVLDPDGDGVYHFTTVTIGSGTTLRIPGDKVNKPVHFLATGDVVISGTIDLNGANATQTAEFYLRRQVSIPGAGGYSGGAGGRTTPPAAPATSGEGPGGGSGGVTSGGPCGTINVCGRGGTFTGNRYLVPLVGGSGGEGAFWTDGTFYSGGAGGGAILLASSTSISMTGIITAAGGSANVGGGGSGGAIRLVAPVLAGGGSLFVNRGGSNGAALANGTAGWVRLEGLQISNSFSFPGGSQFVTRGAPVDPTTLKPSGFVRITAIGGLAVPVYPSGTFTLPDVTLNSATPVNVDIQGTGIPPGTLVTLRVLPDTPDDLSIVYLPPVQATLQGTLQLTTATVSFSFPYGFSRGHVRASWTQ